jgi:inositol-phosphate phosphatase/L-galactose 1-phosphate phosphatase/histidinol-phosphatase
MTPTPAIATDDLAEVETLLATSRAIALRHFRTPLDVERKADLSPVTVADREIEAMFRAAMARGWPEAGFLGEEEGAEGADRARVWVVDPIDGTKAFVTGNPLFGTLVGLLEHGRPRLGVIDMPALNERWAAGDGGATFNGAPCRASACADIAEATLYCTSPDAFAGADAAAFARLRAAARLTRYGGDCYCYGLLASGHADLVAEVGLQPFDYLPLVRVIEAAGGVITDWTGAPLGLGSDGRVLAAATPELHGQALRLIATDA